MRFIVAHDKSYPVPENVEDAILELAGVNYALGARKKGKPAQLLHKAAAEADVRLLFELQTWISTLLAPSEPEAK